MPVTIKDVAREAGVSISTVSRVITGDSRISQPTREKVRAAMARLGYHPNAIARSLVRQRSNTIALVMSRAPRLAMAIPFYPEIIGGISEYATAEHYHLMLVSSESREEECVQTLQLLRHRRVDGVIHLATRIKDPLIDTMRREGHPFVVIGRVPGVEVPSVNNDNVAAAEMAVTHLLDGGYTSVAYVGGSPDLVVTWDRREGYCRALTGRGIPVREDWIICRESTAEAGYEAGIELLSSPDRPQAIFAMDDTLAAGVLKSARKLGISVPQELGLVGFNDDPFSSLIEPALTTVRIPIFEMGREAARMLIGLIGGSSPSQNVVVPAELVVRQSSRRRTPPAG
ncbi:MAG: LacI family transcriptional regulator [Firmicutes bacterium]|nr:LacI family transcriptional regulator [Bacillota bacterium]